jgi:hypothetical protein
MRLGLVLALSLVASPALAQPQPKPQPDQPKPFRELTEEEPEPVPAPAAQPRRVEPADPGELQVVEEPVPVDDHAPPPGSSGTWPEAIAWMETWKPRFATRHVRLDFEVWPQDAFDTYTWDLVLLMGVEDAPVFGDLILPITFLSADGADQFHFGNPTLGVHGGGVLADVVGLWGGLSVSIPTLTEFPAEDESFLPVATLFSAATMRGLVEAHRFFPLTVPVRFGVGVEVQILPFLYFRTELFPAFYIALEELDDATGESFFALLDHVSEAELLSPIGLGGGVRFQEAIGLSSISASQSGSDDDDEIEAGDGAQLAFEPFVSYQPPIEGPYSVPVFARVGLLLAIDDPLGFGFGDGHLATVRTSVGVRF